MNSEEKENILLDSSTTSGYNTNKQKRILEKSSLIRQAHWAFFSLGALNNLCVEIVMCYANDLAKSFNHQDIMTVFHSVMLVCAILTRLVNSYLFLNIKHRYKNISTVFVYVLGVIFMFLAYGTKVFVLTLLASFCFGLGTSLGEVTNLGYMKAFPASVSGPYSSGTGLSGLIGTSFYFLLKIFKFSIVSTNLVMLMFYPLYILAFIWAIRLRRKLKEIEELEGSNEVSNQVETLEEAEAYINKKISWSRFLSVWPYAWGVFIAYFLLYLLEYVSNSWLTSSLVKNHSALYPDPNNLPFFVKYGFEFASVMYRVFLFMGRSSLMFIKIRRYFVSLAILAVLVIFYLFMAIFPHSFPYWLMFVWLCLIALLGGIIFTNILYITYRLPGVPRKYMEIVINIMGCFGEGGMLLSGFSGMVFLRFLINK